jgi:hypothetical protein
MFKIPISTRVVVTDVNTGIEKAGNGSCAHKRALQIVKAIDPLLDDDYHRSDYEIRFFEKIAISQFKPINKTKCKYKLSSYLIIMVS